MLKMQAFFGDGNQHIGANGYPYLCLHRVLAGAKKHLDAKVLLDPLEEQLHLPTLPVQVGNHVWLQREVVGQKYQAFAFVVFDYNAAQCCGVVRAGLVPRQHTRLIADHRCIDSVHRMRIAPLELGIALGAGHKESLGLVNHEEAHRVGMGQCVARIRACRDAWWFWAEVRKKTKVWLSTFKSKPD